MTELRDGFTRIAHRVSRLFQTGAFTKQEYQVIWTVLVWSWAFEGEQATVKALRPRDFAEETGIDRSDVCRILASLIARKILTPHSQADGIHYEFNEHSETWQTRQKKRGEKTNTRGKDPQAGKPITGAGNDDWRGKDPQAGKRPIKRGEKTHATRGKDPQAMPSNPMTKRIPRRLKKSLKKKEIKIILSGFLNAPKPIIASPGCIGAISAG